jgi:pimeloyl-ACP methyl ester carboxylesterase
MADDGAAGTLHTVLIDETPLVYWRHGPPQAPTLVMLHGVGSDHTGLLDLAAHLPGVQLLVPDLPGFGHSPPLPVRHTLHRYAAVLDGLRRHLGLARIAVLGHSLGADIALTYASTYPAAVSALCLLNPVLIADSRVAAWLAQLYYRLCAALPAPLSRPLLSGRAAVYLSDRALLTTRDPATRRRILRQDYATARLADPRAIGESVRSIRAAPFDRYARGLRTRTLLITGTRDGMSTPASLNRLPWRRAYLKLAVLPGAGHLLPVEQPAQVAGILRRFLQASTPARTAA